MDSVALYSKKKSVALCVNEGLVSSLIRLMSASLRVCTIQCTTMYTGRSAHQPDEGSRASPQ